MKRKIDHTAFLYHIYISTYISRFTYQKGVIVYTVSDSSPHYGGCAYGEILFLTSACPLPFDFFLSSISLPLHINDPFPK